MMRRVLGRPGKRKCEEVAVPFEEVERRKGKQETSGTPSCFL